MKTLTKVLTLSILLFSAGGCKKYNGEEAASNRDAWIESLNDSIARISQSRKNDSLKIVELQTRLESDIKNFSYINNSREVEPYYIPTRFKEDYPLLSTGIAARMMLNERIELIAALNGNRFNAIKVTCDGISAQSDVVPADQALNYTSGGLTTVAFTGPKADSIANVVAHSANSPVILQFLENGNVKASINLSDSRKDWIIAVNNLTSARSELQRLERQMLLDSRRLEILRINVAENSNK